MEYRLCSGKELPSPGVCQTCGSAVKDCIDLGFDMETDVITEDLELFGRNAALICVECFDGLAKFMGYSADPLEEAEEKNEALEEYEELLRQARLKSNELFDILNDVSSVIPDFESPFERNSSKENPETENGDGRDSGQDDQPAFFERPDDVSSDSSNESKLAEAEQLLKSTK